MSFSSSWAWERFILLLVDIFLVGWVCCFYWLLLFNWLPGRCFCFGYSSFGYWLLLFYWLPWRVFVLVIHLLVFGYWLFYNSFFCHICYWLPGIVGPLWTCVRNNAPQVCLAPTKGSPQHSQRIGNNSWLWKLPGSAFTGIKPGLGLKKTNLELPSPLQAKPPQSLWRPGIQC